MHVFVLKILKIDNCNTYQSTVGVGLDVAQSAIGPGLDVFGLVGSDDHADTGSYIFMFSL